MTSDSDDALRKRAEFDENAAEILRLAVERGLMSADAADDVITDVRHRVSASGSSSPPSVIKVLSQTGVLDQDTVENLARELGLVDGVTPSPEEVARAEADGSISDPFDIPPIKEWDRYELLKFIGSGGMGDVWKARDKRLGRLVAIKFLRRDTPEIAHRFAREAQVQARIDHDNVCQVYEVGDVEGHAYIAMQYISGGSLKEITDLVSIQEKVQIVVDVADALHAAHQAGLIHRDVKPANILIERGEDGNWRPFVVDFGIARDVDRRDGKEVTLSGMVLGTPAFASPEQVRGESKNLDRRTDVYSLGATMYWFLTDRPPYEGGYPEVLAGITERDPKPPHRLKSGVPVDLETIVLKCLEKEPERRYSTAREVSEDLRRFLAGEAIFARPASLIYKVTKKVRKHKGLAAAIVAVVIAFLMLTGVGLRSNYRARRQAAIAQNLLEKVTEIEGMIRVSSMMPLHDRRPEREVIRERMGQIEEEMARLGDLSLGPGHYALARGYNALQDYDAALKHLQAAVDSGYRTPAVSYNLGLVLGKLYERQLRQARQLENPTLRQAFVRDIEERFRNPALEHLRQSRTSTTEPASYAEGLIAFYEGRYEDALVKARQAFDQAEWLYEAKKLEGDIYVALGTDRMFRGEYDRALDDLDQAGVMYQQASDVARSDASVYAGDCSRWIQVLEIATRLGSPTRSTFDDASRACSRSLEIDPDRSETYGLVSRLHWRWADIVQDGGGDPTKHLDRSVSAAERAIALDPSSATAHYTLGVALTVAGVYDLAQGRDPRPLLNRSVESLGKAIELDPRMAHAHDDLGYAHERIARYAMSSGLDPRESLDRAIASFQRANELNPEYANAYNNAGIALWRRAYYDLKMGRDPRSTLDRAIKSFETAIERNQNYSYAYANRGLAYRTYALHHVENQNDPSQWLELARTSLVRAIDINPKLFWAYPELAAVEVLTARWAMTTGQNPEEHLAGAEAAAARAIEVNSKNAAAYQTAAKVHRWRAEWLLQSDRDVRREIEDGLSLAATALRLNPSLANAMVTRAALLVIDAESRDRRSDVERLIPEALAALDRATEVNPLAGREIDRLRQRALALRAAEAAGRSTRVSSGG